MLGMRNSVQVLNSIFNRKTKNFEKKEEIDSYEKSYLEEFQTEIEKYKG